MCVGGPPSGEIEGERVASGEREGENEGDMADDVLKPPLASCPMGERGRPDRLRWGGRRMGRLIARGATLVSNGGGMWVGGAGGLSTTLPAPVELECDECASDCLLLALDEAPLCSDMLSSLRRAISENTCANG